MHEYQRVYDDNIKMYQQFFTLRSKITDTIANLPGRKELQTIALFVNHK